jgi:hypothetical protein
VRGCWFSCKGCNLRKSRKGDIVRRTTSVFLSLLFLVLATLPALAQQRDRFYNGVRDGGRGGNYYSQRDRDWDRRHRRDQGGVGPGKGALIGAAGGALLGAALGNSLESTLVTGAAGAGIGAILGQANQDSKRDHRRYR